MSTNQTLFREEILTEDNVIEVLSQRAKALENIIPPDVSTQKWNDEHWRAADLVYKYRKFIQYYESIPQKIKSLLRLQLNTQKPDDYSLFIPKSWWNYKEAHQLCEDKDLWGCDVFDEIFPMNNGDEAAYYIFLKTN
jgi:hypothetical protein